MHANAMCSVTADANFDAGPDVAHTLHVGI